MTEQLLNSVIEIPIILMMSALFTASLLKKDRMPRENLVLVITIADIAAILTDFIFWKLSVSNASTSLLTGIFMADRLLAYAIVIAFHYFLLAQISENGKLPVFLYLIPIPMVITVCILYFYNYSTGIYYTISSSGIPIPGDLYPIYSIVKLTLLFVDIVITLAYCDRLQTRRTVLFIVYEVAPVICAVVTSDSQFCIIYLLVSMLILVDYIAVNTDQNIMLAQQKQHLAEQEKKLTVERTKIMISQIQPHFLYNVISSVMECCTKDPKKAVSALADFSDYLRTNMRSLTADMPVPFAKELEHVKTYVRLEKMRFDDRLNVEYDIKTDDFFLPALTLQPIVENAVKHGIGQKPEGGTVTVKTEKLEVGVLITVTDDGIGFNTNELLDENFSSEHVGLGNVRSRISTMCNGLLTINSSKNSGTTVEIFLPFEPDVNN